MIFCTYLGGIEPFDEGLDRHIWSLSDQRLQWDGEIARKRREKPREVHRLMKELLETHQAVDEMEREEYDAIELAEGEEEPDCELVCCLCFSEGLMLNVVPDEIYENVEETARKTFAMVDELQQVCSREITILYAFANCIALECSTATRTSREAQSRYSRDQSPEALVFSPTLPDPNHLSHNIAALHTYLMYPNPMSIFHTKHGSRGRKIKR